MKNLYLSKKKRDNFVENCLWKMWITLWIMRISLKVIHTSGSKSRQRGDFSLFFCG